MYIYKTFLLYLFYHFQTYLFVYLSISKLCPLWTDYLEHTLLSLRLGVSDSLTPPLSFLHTDVARVILCLDLVPNVDIEPHIGATDIVGFFWGEALEVY